MKFKEGEKIWVDIGALRKTWKKKVWKRGEIKKVYESWYLINMGAYLIGAKEQDITRELTKSQIDKDKVEVL